MRNQAQRNVHGAVRAEPSVLPVKPSGPVERVAVLCCRVAALDDGVEIDRRLRAEVEQRFRAVLDEILARFHGYIVQERPTRMWASFRDLQGGKDGARRAMLAAVELRGAAARRVRGKGEFAVCVGVDTGAISLDRGGTLDEQGGADLDQLVEHASELADEAGPHGIVASEATFREAQAHFRFRERGASCYPNAPQLTQLYEVLEERPARSSAPQRPRVHLLTPMCGRRQELEFMLRAWEHTTRGEALVLVLNGPAGIGKSRLVRAFRDSLLAESHERLECGCSELLRNTALHPMIDMLEDRLKVRPEQADQHKLERLEAELKHTGVASPETATQLRALLSVEPRPIAVRHPAPNGAQAAIIDALIAWLTALASQRPTLLIVEDLQWADPSTLALVGRLLSTDKVPQLMLVLTHRPEFSVPWSSTRLWELMVEPLPLRASARFVAALARPRALNEAIVRDVIEKARGVPVYLEEITRALLMASPSSAEPSSILRVPDDSLSLRLDAVGPARATLQLASVLGRRINFELLAAVSQQELTMLRADMETLVSAGLLQVQQRAAQESYAFRHALIQDAAYRSTPRHTRRVYHRRVAETIVDHFPELRATQPELLARQFAAAGLAERATAYFAEAGQRARVRGAYPESIRAYEAALGQLRKLPEGEARDRSEVELRTALGVALTAVHGFMWPKLQENSARALALCEQSKGTSFGAMYGLWSAFLVRGESEPAGRLIEMIESVAKTASDPLLLLAANTTLGTHARCSGDFARALRFFDSAALHCDMSRAAEDCARLEAEHGYDAYITPLLGGAVCRIALGQFEAGFELSARALELAQATGNPHTLAMAYGALAHLAMEPRNDYALARELASREMSIAMEHSLSFWSAMASVHAGFADAGLGSVEIGVAQVTSGVRRLKRLSGFGPIVRVTQLLAEALLLAGDAEQALKQSDIVAQASEGHLADPYKPRALFVKGRALAQLGDLERAEVELRASIALAHRQDSRLCELRSATHLGTLLQMQGRCGEARAVLEPVYLRFEEGFSLPPLIAARELLERL